MDAPNSVLERIFDISSFSDQVLSNLIKGFSLLERVSKDNKSVSVPESCLFARFWETLRMSVVLVRGVYAKPAL